MRDVNNKKIAGRLFIAFTLFITFCSETVFSESNYESSARAAHNPLLKSGEGKQNPAPPQNKRRNGANLTQMTGAPSTLRSGKVSTSNTSSPDDQIHKEDPGGGASSSRPEDATGTTSACAIYRFIDGKGNKQEAYTEASYQELYDQGLICEKCHNVIESLFEYSCSPYRSSSHFFCKACVSHPEHSGYQFTRLCPSSECNKTCNKLTDEELQSQENDIEQLKIMCPADGCNTTATARMIHYHYSLHLCSHKYCQHILSDTTTTAQEQHLSVCENLSDNTEECFFCLKQIDENTFYDHMKVCIFPLLEHDTTHKELLLNLINRTHRLQSDLQYIRWIAEQSNGKCIDCKNLIHINTTISSNTNNCVKCHTSIPKGNFHYHCTTCNKLFCIGCQHEIIKIQFHAVNEENLSSPLSNKDKCPHCQKRFELSLLGRHKKECQKNTETCSFCHKGIQSIELFPHLQKCLNSRIDNNDITAPKIAELCQHYTGLEGSLSQYSIVELCPVHALQMAEINPDSGLKKSCDGKDCSEQIKYICPFCCLQYNKKQGENTTILGEETTVYGFCSSTCSKQPDS